MAVCERSVSCVFFANHKLPLSARQYQFLVATYCQGDLQARCKRKKWREDKCAEPPDELLPNGYFIDLSKVRP